AAAALAALGALSACTSGTSATTSALSVTVSRGSCGGTWQASGGLRTFQVHNVDIVTTEVDLIDPATGGVYAEVESLAPNATRPMQVQLGHGRYAFRCYPEDTDALNGPTVRITTGEATGSSAVLPLSGVDLAPAVKTYKAYVNAGLATLATEVATLDAAVNSGDRTRAQAAWLPAHLRYNRLGAAYDSFGDFADEIDGMPDGLPGGVNDPDFAGFHRVEYGLWHGESMVSLAKPADALVSAVAGLRKNFPTEQIDPNDLPLRAHEILENTLQFQLSGHADEGSGTSLATAVANVDGTQAVLNAIAPEMSARYTGWAHVATWITTARSALAVAARPGGGWTPVAALSVADRQRIDSAVGGLLEALAPIAAIGDVRRTND
ncbi:MAG TPA: EfeM/EfeO family lipoprotein, partial [Micromonosporaceae bacterium]